MKARLSVHEGGVKLKAIIAGAGVKDATANSLQNQANTKGVKYAVLSVRTEYLIVFIFL